MVELLLLAAAGAFLANKAKAAPARPPDDKAPVTSPPPPPASMQVVPDRPEDAPNAIVHFQRRGRIDQVIVQDNASDLSPFEQELPLGRQPTQGELSPDQLAWLSQGPEANLRGQIDGRTGAAVAGVAGTAANLLVPGAGKVVGAIASGVTAAINGLLSGNSAGMTEREMAYVTDAHGNIDLRRLCEVQGRDGSKVLGDERAGTDVRVGGAAGRATRAAIEDASSSETP